MGVGGQRHARAALNPQERPGTHCTGGWMGPRAGVDGCGKSRPNRDSTVLLHQFRSSGMLCRVSSDCIDVSNDRVEGP